MAWFISNENLVGINSKYPASAFRVGGVSAIFTKVDTQEDAIALPIPIAYGQVTEIPFKFAVVSGTPPNFRKVSNPDGAELGVTWSYESSFYLHHQLPLSDPITAKVCFEVESSGLTIDVPDGFVLTVIETEGLRLEGEGFTQVGTEVVITSQYIEPGQDLLLWGDYTLTPPAPYLRSAFFRLPDASIVSRIEWMGQVFNPLLSDRPEAGFFVWNQDATTLALFVDPALIPAEKILVGDRAYRTTGLNTFHF